MGIKSNSTGGLNLRAASLNELVRTCDSFDKIVVSIFKLENQKFTYYSKSVNNIIGYNPQHLIEGGWDLWYSFIKSSERPVIKYELKEFMNGDSLGNSKRRLTLKYHLKKVPVEWTYIRHVIKLEKFISELFAISYIYDYSETELADRYLTTSEERLNRLHVSLPEVAISEREKQVLKLIGCGLSSKQIADKLFISIHTAISHRKNLIEKFEVKNTAELIKEASKVISL